MMDQIFPNFIDLGTFEDTVAQFGMTITELEGWVLVYIWILSDTILSITRICALNLPLGLRQLQNFSWVVTYFINTEFLIQALFRMCLSTFPFVSGPR